MGLFKKAKKPVEQPAEIAEQVFDEKYRQELRNMGRDHFKRLLDDNSAGIKQDVDVVLAQLTSSLRRHMATQLDLAITRVNSEISNSLKEQMTDFNRVSGESQELVIQSLSRNAQAVHEIYQQMSTNLQQVIANQEVMMVGVFQDNQSRVSTIQLEQDRALGQLKDNIAKMNQQSESAVAKMTQSSDEQSKKLTDLYQKVIDGANEMSQSQDGAINQLLLSVESLEQQHARLKEMIDESITKQKSMIADVIDEHMSRIIEHYLIGALGERSDLAKDMPGILEKMQEHKQEMMDDMKL